MAIIILFNVLELILLNFVTTAITAISTLIIKPSIKVS